MAESLAQCREFLRSAPDDLSVMNMAAWIEATCPDASLRKGTEAVRLAQRAVELSGGREPMLLDTLAAANAEIGRFADAIRVARQAAALAAADHQTALAAAIQARIALYEAGLPFREAR